MEQAWEIAYGKLSSLSMESLGRMLARRDAQVGEWLGMMENERNSLTGISGTMWSALNAVTEYMDHGHGRFKPVAESEARVHSNLFGAVAANKTKILKAALQLS